MNHRARRPPRPAGAAALALASALLAGLLGSGTCVVAYHSCTGRCCPHHDPLPPDCQTYAQGSGGDLQTHAAAAAASEALLAFVAAGYRLEHYRLVRSDDPARHPVRALAEVRGAGLAGPFDAYELLELCDRVIAANPLLLGVPPGCGEVRRFELQESTSSIEVFYSQVVSRADGDLALPGAGLRFVFDPRGALLHVDNDLRARLDPTEHL